ncbi:hypothetical protein [Teredinibacter sp. KSP-S5-2]|nr:hypothetical protein [Teredinibacter sp. KSP-S5-2]WNO08842.1 hypothetical protein P5V12_17875 [Teredinibacter sp. KSP-S5-2]
MKTDVLTLAALVFVVGLLASGLGLTDVFDKDPVPPAALQQGVATR